MDIDIERATDLAHQAADKGRETLLKYFKNIKKIEKKHLAGLVTEADRESENKIIEVLSPLGVRVVGEEAHSGADYKSELFQTGQTRWLIDPLDGTTNFVHGFSIFCVSIALQVKGKTILSLVDVPLHNRRYFSTTGNGATCNGEPIYTSDRKLISESLAATGFFAENPAALERQLKIFSAFSKVCRGMRRSGSAAFDLCMVAEGVFDLFWEENLQPWDTAAGYHLISEAGGRVSDYKGRAYTPESKNILACNSNNFEEALSYFSDNFKN